MQLKHKPYHIDRLYVMSITSWMPGFESTVGSSQRLKNWQLLLCWLAFTI